MNKIIAQLLLSATLLGVPLTVNAGVESEPNDSRSQSNTLSVNDVLDGTFTIDSNGRHDYYHFTLTESSTNVTVSFRNKVGNSSVSYFYLIDGTGRQLRHGTINAFDTTVSSFTQSLGAGVFYIYCYSAYAPNVEPINYTLSVSAKVSVTPSIVGSVGLVDLNKNTKKDLAILRILADASSQIEIRDGSTGDVINIIPLPDGLSLKPVSIAGFNDINVAVIIYDGLTQTNTQYIFNAKSGVQVASFPLD